MARSSQRIITAQPVTGHSIFVKQELVGSPQGIGQSMATLLIKSIRHLSEERFAEAFRQDLADASESVVVLSPFLSRSKAAFYGPVFELLKMNDVEVRVYAKPQDEQPEWLRAGYLEIVSHLKRQGVSFFTRIGMHEKIAIIDGEILWHGSLNILSHNDTRESMLRLESRDLIQEIVTALAIGSSTTGEVVSPNIGPGDDLESDSADLEEIAACPSCGSPMHWFAEAALWVCSQAPGCSAIRPADLPDHVANGDPDFALGRELHLSCPCCEKLMEIRRGAFTRVACPSSDCGFSLDPRLSAWIVRSLRRKQLP